MKEEQQMSSIQIKNKNKSQYNSCIHKITSKIQKRKNQKENFQIKVSYIQRKQDQQEKKSTSISNQQSSQQNIQNPEKGKFNFQKGKYGQIYYASLSIDQKQQNFQRQKFQQLSIIYSQTDLLQMKSSVQQLKNQNVNFLSPFYYNPKFGFKTTKSYLKETQELQKSEKQQSQISDLNKNINNQQKCQKAPEDKSQSPQSWYKKVILNGQYHLNQRLLLNPRECNSYNVNFQKPNDKNTINQRSTDNKFDIPKNPNPEAVKIKIPKAQNHQNSILLNNIEQNKNQIKQDLKKSSKKIKNDDFLLSQIKEISIIQPQKQKQQQKLDTSGKNMLQIKSNQNQNTLIIDNQPSNQTYCFCQHIINVLSKFF